MQQQMQQQIKQQQVQTGSGIKNSNAQNMNFALMAAQQNQNQNQPKNNFSNSNILQSFMGRNPQFTGGGVIPMQGQTNMHQNPFLGQLMFNQQQSGIGAIGATGLIGSNPAGTMMSGISSGPNNFQLPLTNSLISRDSSRRMRGGVIEPFPEKLHRLLLEVEAAGRADVISFVANGRAFAIHKADQFFKEIVPLYFRQSRLSSFKRQLNLYGFELINTGPARGGYYHEMFVKERPELCRRMRRVALKIAPSSKESTAKKSKNKDSGTDNPKPIEAESLSIKEILREDDKNIESVDDLEGITKDDEEQASKEVVAVSIDENTDQGDDMMNGKLEEKVDNEIDNETEAGVKQLKGPIKNINMQDKEEVDGGGENSNKGNCDQTTKTELWEVQVQKTESADHIET
mmetsp:Transcript_14435/g.33580  ORF Transcript_14435/g.33580 Transcript_14435/m.33580 type:complete len:402 (-) Transcript_14435:204-1409(-)